MAERPQLTRSSTEHGSSRKALARPARSASHHDNDETWELRHGWEEQYNSEDYLTSLNSSFYMYFTEKRHESGGLPSRPSGRDDGSDHWRVKSRTKTVLAGLMLCLNIGVDPPDVVKTNPTAVLESWIDPTEPTPANIKVMDRIAKALAQQYEALSLRIRYKEFADPSIDEARKYCVSLRRTAKEERILLHYNGHGVPLPTPSGEIWFFNRKYTKYIPVSLYDLQLWLGGPAIYVLDVAHAGHVTANFSRFVDKHEAENREMLQQDPQAQVQQYGDNILLVACGKDQTLPTNPILPADLFTCCLTTPVTISLRCFIQQGHFAGHITLDDLDKIPGRLQERRSPLGELNWIFTAITDTIAWNSLPRDLFKKLFRQDLMVAALFRNYLLADRIMRANGCTPQTEPALPETHEHPLWQSWDLAIEMVLSQLPALMASEAGGPQYEYQHSSFFAEQLTAFEIYLSQGALQRKAPAQLPIVLQVLLSQVHRLRALILLGRFLDLGPWAVHLALKIGIFPYVLKLLQSAAYELKPVLIFIWTRILAVDGSCQSDLLRDNGYRYFLTVLKPEAGLPVTNASEHRAMSAFIIAMFCRDFRQAQHVSVSRELFVACIDHLQDQENPLLRQWSCLCISMLWKDFVEAKWTGMRVSTHHHLCRMVLDPVPEVRAAAVHALTTFLGFSSEKEQAAQTESSIAATIMLMTADGNSMVRMELLVFFSTFIKRYENKFLVTAFEEMRNELRRLRDPVPSEQEGGRFISGQGGRDSPELTRDGVASSFAQHTVYGTIWTNVLIMTVDPHAAVSQSATLIADYVHQRLLQSALGVPARAAMEDLVRLGAKRPPSRPPSPTPLPRLAELPSPAPSSEPRRNASYFSLSLQRTASAASALKHFAFGGTTTPPERARTPDPEPSHVMGGSGRERPRSGGLRTRVPDEWSRPPDAHDATSQPTSQPPARLPLPRNFTPSEESNVTVELPLHSTFFDWSIEYFREPQMKTNEPEEPGSDDYNARLWRRMRNERIINQTQPLKTLAASSPWSTPHGTLANGTQPLKLAFHQFEDQLAVADDRDTICIWQWEQRRRLSRFANGNPPGSRVNDVRFLNEDDQALLLTGSSDGVIKIFREYESAERVEVVTTFRGVTDRVPSTKNVGLVLDWQQTQGKLLVSGDVPVIRVWNAATEICTSEFPSRSQACVTALTSDQVAGHVFVAGFGNGKIQVYDQRQKPSTSMVQRYSSHKQWITNVHMQRGGLRELVSASRNGEIRLWDIRMPHPLRTIQATSHTLRTMSVHEHAPVFATGDDAHHVKFFGVNGECLNTLEPASSTSTFLQSRTAPIAATAFHPHQMILAATSLQDPHVNLVSVTDRRSAKERTASKDS